MRKAQKNTPVSDQVRDVGKSASLPVASDENKALVFDTVFIVTYGRSGSTLLQGMLNTIDGVLIRGENNNFIFKLFEAYKALSFAKKKFGTVVRDSTKAWFGIETIDENAFISDLRQAVRRTLLSDRASDNNIQCIGFKEIRYPATGERLGPYLDFLSVLFPNTAFIMLTRDLDQVSKSAWWANDDTEWVHTHLNAFEDRARKYAETRSNCFMIDYSDLIEKTQVLKGMFAFLGAPYCEEDIARILSTPHSY